MRFSRSLMVTGLAAGMALVVSGCGDDGEDMLPQAQPQGSSQNLIPDVAAKAGNFNTLLAALGATGLDEALSGEGPFTVFAPTDEAFARLPDGVVAQLLDAPQTLSSILTYHVMSGAVDSSIALGVAGSAANMVATLSDVGDNELSLRVVDGTLVINETIQVTAVDIKASNGVIHVIDAVMLPRSIPFPGDLVDALSAKPFFSTLVGAVASAELVSALQSDNNGDGFTVFAPTNAAFAALGLDLGTLSSAELQNVLLYHVVGGTVDASTVVGLSSAATLQGGTVGINIDSGSVILDGGATVVRTDIRAGNGIIHVLDAVLLP